MFYGWGNASNELRGPQGFYVDDDQTILIADTYNQRIVEWKFGAASGQVVAGGNGQGRRTDQFNKPMNVIVDRQTNSLIICDRENRRVMRWSRRSGTTSGETIVKDIDCYGLTMDNQGFLYVSVFGVGKNDVRRYRIGETNGTLVASSNQEGDRLNQLDFPNDVFVDRDQSIYVSEYSNQRVTKWVKGAKEGIVVAGGQGKGNDLTQLSGPTGVFVDLLGTVYVADSLNSRVMRWCNGATQGDVIVGGNGWGSQANQMGYPVDLSFDQYGNLYVIEEGTDRIHRFSIKATN
jgi:sugar lactone lactonase YvrE